MAFYQFQLKKDVALLGKYLDPRTLSSYKDDLDIDGDSESDDRSSILEEEIGVDEKDKEIILSVNEEISLDTIVSAGKELFQRFIFEDCVIEHVGGIQTLHLSAECCQGRMFSSEGCKACVLISVLIGYALINYNYMNAIDLHEIWNHISPLFCGAIERGNHLYDYNVLQSMYFLGR